MFLILTCMNPFSLQSEFDSFLGPILHNNIVDRFQSANMAATVMRRKRQWCL